MRLHGLHDINTDSLGRAGPVCKNFAQQGELLEVPEAHAYKVEWSQTGYFFQEKHRGHSVEQSSVLDREQCLFLKVKKT